MKCFTWTSAQTTSAIYATRSNATPQHHRNANPFALATLLARAGASTPSARRDDTLLSLSLFQPLFSAWVNLGEHKWSTLGERRRSSPAPACRGRRARVAEGAILAIA